MARIHDEEKELRLIQTGNFLSYCGVVGLHGEIIEIVMETPVLRCARVRDCVCVSIFSSGVNEVCIKITDHRRVI